MSRSRVLIWIGLMVVSLACGGDDTSDQTITMAKYVPPERTADASARAPEDPKLIRNAQIELDVADTQGAMAEATTIAGEQGGFVQAVDVLQDSHGRRSGSMTCRVPAANLDAAIARLRALGEVRRSSVNSRDVTWSHADLEIRLDVKRRTEQRIRELLGSRTGKLSEVLEAERELERIVGEIEGLVGEKKHLETQIEMSAIVLQVREDRTSGGVPWTEPITSSARKAIHVLAESIGYLVYALVFVLPWMLLACAIWWLTTRRR